ncbi:arginine--tRNA ligase [Bacillus mesophilum]|uniref:arginine--tRNA ligase n=1 Tax=Bacillus mesophilum TaxID=1071718 RepID=UPI0018653A0C|nr:arginine--tRNA ligase [Bacillus mesophilum]
MDFKKIFSSALNLHFHDHMSLDQIEALIETPKNPLHGDLAFPCFQLAKALRKNPAEIAQKAALELQGSLIHQANAVGPYLNVFFSKEAASAQILEEVLKQNRLFGTNQSGKNKTALLDYSSPNIAKPFSMGHLRSTVIGNALANLAEACGYQTVRINYIGDWGTQFGKLITAYQKWGSPSAIEKQPIQELFKLYVRFHEEENNDTELTAEARRSFKKLEDGDQEAEKLWKWFRDESLTEFQRIYKLLNISFDSYQGEAFYNDKMGNAVSALRDKGLLSDSEGAEVVYLDDGLPPCLIKKSDGATLYATRDITAALYRKTQYQFDHALYIVGQEQSVHFKQVKQVIKKLGCHWADDLFHIPFGLYLKDGQKMSTRKGKVILLEEVVLEAIKLAEINIDNKNPNLENKKEIAKAVGVGAILFHDLKNDRMNSIEFSLKDMLTFEGETGPYLQYTNARAFSILRKSSLEPASVIGLSDSASWEVLKSINSYPVKIIQSYTLHSPAILAKHLLEISKNFNKYYSKVHILENDELLPSRLALVKAVTITLSNGMKILGMEAPEKM